MEADPDFAAKHAPQDDTDPVSDLTNGAETFEALQWTAWGAMQTMQAGGALSGNPDLTVLGRIRANCRQIKEAALRLEQQNAPPTGLGQLMARRGPQQSSKISSRERLGLLAVRREPAAQAAVQAAPTESRLFGATIEETARALFQHPRPIFNVDPDVTVLIRKAWDVGVERVCLQTVLQVDGDVLQTIGQLQANERDFLTLVHKQAVKESVTQWRSLFDLLRQLAGDVGRVVFGGR